MSDSVDRVFVHALNTVKKIPRTGSARPPAEDRLRLYGLYKQSMEGDVEGVMTRPLAVESRGKGGETERGEMQKWDAWSAQHGLSRTSAKRQYITTLISTMHKYASSTPEARELVAELEFVWDQIKSNAASNATSSAESNSPEQRAPVNKQMLGPDYPSIGPPSYASIGPARGTETESALRILRPVSDADENEVEDEDDEDGVDGGERFDEARDSTGMHRNTGDESLGQRNYEIRNRKWRKGMEAALVKLAVEVAALREQIEGGGGSIWIGSRDRRKGVSAWIVWLAGGILKHVFADVVVLALFAFWTRRRKGKGKGKGLIEGGFRMVVDVLEERIKRVIIALGVSLGRT